MKKSTNRCNVGPFAIRQFSLLYCAKSSIRSFLDRPTSWTCAPTGKRLATKTNFLSKIRNYYMTCTALWSSKINDDVLLKLVFACHARDVNKRSSWMPRLRTENHCQQVHHFVCHMTIVARRLGPCLLRCQHVSRYIVSIRSAKSTNWTSNELYKELSTWQAELC